LNRDDGLPLTVTAFRRRNGCALWISVRLLRCLCLVVAMSVAFLAGSPGELLAQSDDGSDISREYAIKAAYLYQFARYVEWPADAFVNEQSPLVIGVLGTDPFGAILEEIAIKKRVEGHPIVIRRFASGSDYTTCHILFISSSVTPEERAAAIRKVQGTPVLLVGDEPGFAAEGGTINFVMEENKIRFEINTEVAKREQLKISSKLLSLAKIIR
jgi:hypothetical protein